MEKIEPREQGGKFYIKMYGTEYELILPKKKNGKTSKAKSKRTKAKSKAKSKAKLVKEVV